MAERTILHLTPAKAAELGHELLRLATEVGRSEHSDAYAYTKTFEDEGSDLPEPPLRIRVRIGR